MLAHKRSARDLEIGNKAYHPLGVTCHMSCVVCQMSHVQCNVSLGVNKKKYNKIIEQVVTLIEKGLLSTELSCLFSIPQGI